MESAGSKAGPELARLFRKLARVRHWPPRDILTFGHAVVLILAVEVLIRFVPLPHLGRRLGVPVNLDPAPIVTEQFAVDELTPTAQRQLRCAGKVADVWPFSKGPCLRRALVGGHLIRALEPSIRLGVRGAGDTLIAHAWLEIDGRALEQVDDFARFERPTLDQPTPSRSAGGACT